jgi:hypothetical protein
MIEFPNRTICVRCDDLNECQAYFCCNAFKQADELLAIVRGVISEWHASTRQAPGAIIRHAEDLFAKLKRAIS